MALFKIDDNKLKKMKVGSFKNEKELQKLCEDNLEELFQVRFVESEFRFGDEYCGRMDTIGLDYEGNPVIIEYKLEKNATILSQSLFYMDWLVNHRGDFELAVRNKLGNDIEISWTNPKMLLVAQDYNRYDKYAVNRINYDIYLYKYTYYDTGELYLENINVCDNKKYYVEDGRDDSEEVSERYARLTYTLDHHLDNCSETARALFNELNDHILEISDQIEVRINKYYVGYRTMRSFAEIFFKKNSLQVYVIKVDKSYDPEDRLESVPASYQWAADFRMEVKDSKDIEYVMNIIRESYRNTL